MHMMKPARILCEDPSRASFARIFPSFDDTSLRCIKLKGSDLFSFILNETCRKFVPCGSLHKPRSWFYSSVIKKDHFVPTWFQGTKTENPRCLTSDFLLSFWSKVPGFDDYYFMRQLTNSPGFQKRSGHQVTRSLQQHAKVNACQLSPYNLSCARHAFILSGFCQCTTTASLSYKTTRPFRQNQENAISNPIFPCG
jgi:hypothetical protein